MNSTIKNYRADIDGLRAIAVMLVVFFHIGFKDIFPAGFIGVDVFFVISGFLITKIIYSDIKNHKFSYKNFYLRRIRRLLPALTTVLILTSLAAFFILLPADLINYCKSLISTVLFSANFYMWKVTGNYFGANSETIPLLHFWSLAVEEQFYFVWPTVLILLSKRLKASRLLFVLIAIFAVTLMASEWGATHYPAASYFLIPTRAFELLLGACLALTQNKRIQWNRVYQELLSVICLIAIIAPAILMKKDAYFPGFNALLPCVGTALLIYMGGSKTTFVDKLLSVKSLVFLGLISYPLYLVHWPIAAFLNYMQVQLTIPISIAIIVISIGISYMIWKYIETPIRKQKNENVKNVFLAYLIVPTSLFIALAFVVIESDGLTSRFSNELNFKNKAVNSWSIQLRGRCNEGSPSHPLPPDKCRFGDAQKSNVDLLLVGDSHANHFVGLLDVLAKDAHLRGYDITQSQTPLLQGVQRYYKKAGELVSHSQFPVRNKFLIDLIKKNKYQFVVLAASLEAYGHPQNEMYFINKKNHSFDPKTTLKVLKDSLLETIETIQNTGAVVFIIAQTPSTNTDLSSCTINNELYNKQVNCHPSVEYMRQQQKFIHQIYQEVKLSYPTVHLIEPAKLLCDAQFCYTEIDGIPMYRDRGHLNDTGSRYLGKKWIEKFGNPFKELQ